VYENDTELRLHFNENVEVPSILELERVVGVNDNRLKLRDLGGFVCVCCVLIVSRNFSSDGRMRALYNNGLAIRPGMDTYTCTICWFVGIHSDKKKREENCRKKVSV
jgi:hypothetical protein